MRRPIAVMLLAGLSLGPVLAPASIPPAYSGAGHAFDPAVFVSNASGDAVTLSWQTEVPGLALSPVRRVEVPAAAEGWRAPEGFFLFGAPDGGLAEENVVYVSLHDDAGGIAAQRVLDDEIDLDPAALERLTLHISIATDGGLTAEIR